MVPRFRSADEPDSPGRRVTLPRKASRPARPGPNGSAARQRNELRARWPDRVAAALRQHRRGGKQFRRVRRALALALLLVAAALALAPQRSIGGVDVFTATRDLPPGTVLTDKDLQRRTDAHPPDGAVADAGPLLGRPLAAAVRRGQILTDSSVVPASGPRPGPGRVAVPVQLPDPGPGGLLVPGVHLAVLAVDDAGAARPLTVDAVVLSVARTAQERSQGPVAGGSARTVGCLLAVPTKEADALAAASLGSRLAVRFT